MPYLIGGARVGSRVSGIGVVGACAVTRRWQAGCKAQPTIDVLSESAPLLYKFRLGAWSKRGPFFPRA